MEKTDLRGDRLQMQGLAKAAERYKMAMQDAKSRDVWIEDYLPLVKSIVSRILDPPSVIIMNCTLIEEIEGFLICLSEITKVTPFSVSKSSSALVEQSSTPSWTASRGIVWLFSLL